MINLKVLKLLIVLLILCSLFQLTIEQELDKREPQAQTSPPAQTQPPSSPPAQTQPPSSPPAQTQPPSSPPAQTQPPSSPPAQTAVPTATTPANATTTTNSTTTNSTLPPAGDQPVRIKVVNPPLSTNLLLKIGKVQTFNWTYTSQFDPSLAPKSLNVFAIYNDATGYNYTIARDLPPSSTFVTWNTTTSNPELPAGTYTLNIWDEKGPQPGNVIGGQLLPYADLHFVMYKPQQRVDLSSYTCAVCDGNSPITRAEQSKPYLPIAVLGGILVATVLFVIFVKV